jgi:hypothetical protein
VLKVIVANSAMIKAFKAGVPLNGKAFPEGSMIVKLQWSPKKDTEATFDVEVPDAFKQAFVMEKDSKRFPKTGGWGYAVFNYDAASNKFTPDPTSHADCGNSCHVAVKGEGLHLSPVREALNWGLDIEHPSHRMPECEVRFDVASKETHTEPGR